MTPTQRNLPRRIQRKRTKGWRKPPGAVNCTRPGPWGNPFPVDHDGTRMHAMSMCLDPDDKTDRAIAAIDLHRTWLLGGNVNELVFLMLPDVKRPPSQRIIRRELRGRDLMCFCSPCQPCHVDTYLILANAPHCEGSS